jgi:hypothetical protein
MREDFVNNPGAVPSGEELARGESTSPFTVHKLSPKNIELLRRITGDDIRSVTHPKGLPINLFNFLHQVLRFDVISTNKDGEPSFLNEQGKIEVRSPDGTTSLLEPQKLSDFLMRAKEEIGDTIEFTPEEKVTAVVPKILTDEEYKNLDRSSRYERDTVELPENETQPGESDSSSDPDDFLDTEDKYPTLEMPTNEENPEEDTYDDEVKFIQAVGSLGLQIISHNGEEYTVKSFMPGAGPVTVSRSELISQLESKDDPVPPRLEEMVNEFDDALIMTPEKLRARFVQPMEQRTSPALAHEVQKAKEKVREMESYFFDTRFETQFGISKEDLESIDGFTELSKEQQKLVYENFAQCVLGDVKHEAERLTASVPAERREEVTGKIRQKFKSFVTGFRDSVTSTSRNIQNEKDVLASMRSGGFAMHGEFIKTLVQNVREYGPRRVHETENGELIVDLVNLEGRATGKLRGEEWKAMRELNIAAHEFAGIPPGWRGQNLGTESEWKFVRFLRKNILRSDNLLHEAKYKEAEEKYKNARTELETTLRNRGMSEFEIKEVLFGIDARMLQLQAYHASPDAIAELEQIEDKSVIKEYATNFLKNAGPYMALGFVVRSATVASLSILGPVSIAGVPVVSSVIAHLRSWDKKDAELRERDRSAIRGIKDTSEGALNVNDAEDLTEKMKYLIDRCRSTTVDKRPALLAQLRARVEYVRDKQMLGRVNYGEERGKLGRTNDLSSVVFEALTYLGMEGGIQTESELESTEARYTDSRERLKFKLESTDARIRDTRKQEIREKLSYRNSDMRIGVETAILATLVGQQAADWTNNLLQKSAVPRGVPSSAPMSAPELTIPKEAPPVTSFPEELIPRTPGIDTPSQTGEFGTLSERSDVIPIATSIPETIPQSYTIKSGDTLTKILTEQSPDIKELPTPQARSAAVAKIIEQLKPAELRAIGIASEDADIIRAGDRIDIAKLNEMVSADLSLLDADAVTTSLQTPSMEETPSSGAREESIREATTTTEQPTRPGQKRPEFRSSTLPSEAVIPRAEVAGPRTNNVVDLDAFRREGIAPSVSAETVARDTQTPGNVSGDVPEARPVRPGPVRPGLPKEAVPSVETGKLDDDTSEQPPVTETIKTPERPQLVRDLPREIISPDFKNTFITGKIPVRDWAQYRKIPVETINSTEINFDDTTIDPTRRKLAYLMGVIKGATNLDANPGETIEEYMKRGDEIMQESESELSKRRTTMWRLRYEDAVRDIDHPPLRDNQPKIQGMKIRALRQR